MKRLNLHSNPDGPIHELNNDYGILQARLQLPVPHPPSEISELDDTSSSKSVLTSDVSSADSDKILVPNVSQLSGYHDGLIPVSSEVPTKEAATSQLNRNPLIASSDSMISPVEGSISLWSIQNSISEVSRTQDISTNTAATTLPDADPPATENVETIEVDVDQNRLVQPRVPIKIDRSTIPKRQPTSKLGTHSTGLKNALASAVQGQKHNIVEQLLNKGISPDTGPEKNSLIIAVLNRDIACLKLLLDFGADPNLLDPFGAPPLRYACDNRLEEAEVLLKYGADPNLSAPNMSCLCWAILLDYKEMVQLMLHYSADANKDSKNDESAVVYAAKTSKDPDILQELIDWGGNVNVKSQHGSTPLEEACRHKKVEIVDILLQNGADPNLPGGEYPISLATGSVECLKLLLAAGADIRLHKGLIELATFNKSIEAIQILLDHGADINEKAGDHFLPTTTAIRDNHPEILQFLLKNGADPNKKGEGVHPIIMAITHPEMIEDLILTGADLSQCSEALEYAVYRMAKETIQLLLKHGVSPDQKNPHGLTPLCTAVRDSHDELVHLLLDKGADINLKGPTYPIEQAVDKPDLLRILIQRGANVSKVPGILEMAVWRNNITSFRILLNEAHADINGIGENRCGALTTAIRDNRMEFLRELISNGADLNMATADGLPIIRAAALEDSTILAMLLEAGANVDLRLEDGNTALIAACVHGRKESVRLLMEKGADIELANFWKETAMDIAARQGHDEIVMILLGD